MNFIFILMCIVYGLCAIYFATKNDYTTICFFLTTILFQNIIVILFSDTASSMWITIFSLIKEGMLYLSIVLYAVGLVKRSLNNTMIYVRDHDCYHYLKETFDFPNLKEARDLAFLDIPYQDDQSKKKKLQSEFGLETDRSILNILITHSYAMFIFQFYNTWLALDFKYKKFLVVSGINSIGGTLLSIFLILVVFKEHKYIGRIYGYAIVPICVAAVIWLCFFRDAKKTKQVLFNTNYWKYGLSISLPLVVHTFSQQILSQFDRIMIGALVSVAAVGIYGFIQTIASILQIIVQSMDNAWSVWMYEQLDQKQYTQIQDKSKAYILLMNILYVGFISLAPDVIHIAGTKEYYDGISMVIPLSFAIYFIFLYSLPVHIEYFYKKTKFIATGTSLAAGINIVLNYFFIRSYGYTASAWTTLASYFLLFVFHWFIAKKIDENPMFPNKTIIGSIIALSAFSAWTILIINHMLIRWISMLLFIVLLLICNSKTILPLADKIASKLKNR